MARRPSPEQALTIYRKARQKGKREALLQKELDTYRQWVINQNPTIDPNGHILDNLVRRKRTMILRDMKKEVGDHYAHVCGGRMHRFK